MMMGSAFGGGLFMMVMVMMMLWLEFQVLFGYLSAVFVAIIIVVVADFTLFFVLYRFCYLLDLFVLVTVSFLLLSTAAVVSLLPLFLLLLVTVVT
jgi:hypothetical protein